MAISPNQQETLAIAIRRIYADAETILLEKIANKLKQGIDEPNWQERKILQVRELRAEVEKLIGTVKVESMKEIEDIITKAYTEGQRSADADLKEVSVIDNFGVINTRALEALVKEGENLLNNVHFQVLRSTQDIYQKVIYETVGATLTGAETRRQAAQRALNKFADKGVVAFIDKLGRNWEMATYTEMSTRAAIANASIQGHIDRMVEHGRDLVIVSDSPGECERCRPWERKILSISGNTPNYPTVTDARNAGVWHPGCTHNISAYIEGLTKIGNAKAEPDDYELRQQQRYNERMIRRWKKREAVALTDKEKALATSKRTEWQKRNKEFTEKHDLRRKYERESITAAR